MFRILAMNMRQGKEPASYVTFCSSQKWLLVPAKPEFPSPAIDIWLIPLFLLKNVTSTEKILLILQSFKLIKSSVIGSDNTPSFPSYSPHHMCDYRFCLCLLPWLVISRGPRWLYLLHCHSLVLVCSLAHTQALKHSS